jgi:hypothetical protein
LIAFILLFHRRGLEAIAAGACPTARTCHGTSNPLYRGGGSIGIIGSARTGLLVGVDPDDADGRILAPVKSNLSRLAPSLKYRREVHPLLNVCRVEWTGTSPDRADRLIQAPPTPEQREEIEETPTKEETCREYLREILRDGPVEVRLMKTELGKAGFAVRTVEGAARAFDVTLRRDTEDGRNVYSWELGGAAEAGNCRDSPTGY